MSYHVLARKWRPRNFQQMVGQEHVLRMLASALDSERLHHAYLFTGTRGVGKTTLARILAKCLNCEKKISSIPCDQCSACQSIDAGRFLDLIEVDGASRTKVEDTRELLDNVQYLPSQGRFKIYLIDEVHMLSGHSFNALLKTLEEPPLHVKFLLATTDPKRLPLTVLSRCLQFNLKHVPIEKITAQLQHICQSEKIPFEKPALILLAQAADGSMRDALSLLDQAITFCTDSISTQNTSQMLGHIEQNVVFQLLDALAEQNHKKLFAEIKHLAEFAPDFNQVLEELLSILHQISLMQILKELPDSHEKIKQFASQFTPEDIQLYYQIALMGRHDLPLAPHPLQGFEMILLRMLAFQPMPENPSPATPLAPKPNTLTAPLKKISITDTLSSPSWENILPKLQLTGLAQSLASHSILNAITDSKISLTLTAAYATLLNKKQSDRIEEALTRYFNKPITLDIAIASEELHTPAKQDQEQRTIRHIQATESLQKDNAIQTILETFDATLDVSSIKPIDLLK